MNYRVSLLNIRVCLILLLSCLAMSSCYKMDDDGGTEGQMLDRRIAQSHIISSYNQWCSDFPMVRPDLEKLANLDSLLNLYEWEGKDEADGLTERCTQALLVGDLTAFRDALKYFDAHAGVYEADDDKVIRKVEDGDHQLNITFNDTTTLAFSWQTTEADNGSNMTVDMSLRINDYLLAGSTVITNDSVGSFYRLTKDGVDGNMLTLQKTMKGDDLLDAVQSEAVTYICPTSTELRLQLTDDLCLYQKAGNMDAVYKFIMENSAMKVTNPKQYVQEVMKLRGELERTWLTRSDGVALCELFTGEESDGEETVFSLYLCWNDDEAQPLLDFASSYSNDNFAKDMALLNKLFFMI